jgi:diguanylate cyclase (GGDEF)-like protein/PAS domain S-box-containing protein
MQPLSPEHVRALRTIVAADHGAALTKLEDGSEALVASHPLTMTDWVVAAVLPRAEAFVAIDHARHRTIESAFVVAVLVLPLTWLIAWFLLKPLTRLRDEVESAARHPDPTNLATSKRRDEVGEVALAFNALLDAQRTSDAMRIASDQDRRRLVAILESSSDFVAMADVSGNLTYLNASARRCCVIGLDDDLSQRSIRNLFPAWAMARLEKEGVPAALANGSWMGETAILDAGGNEVPVDQTVIAHRNVEGKLEFFSSLLHDTSAAKAASAAMRSSEARMLSISDALPVMVAFVDRECRYRFVNSRYEDHFGVDKTHLLGKSIAEMIGESAFEVYRPFFERASSGAAQVFEIESHAGVRPMHFLVKLIPQFDDLDRVTGFHFIHQDVTDHKVENQRLSQLVRADALTGLLNRAGFESAIGDAMARSHHHLSAMALFYLDVDRFKSINDQYGHQIGDKLLRGFASRLVRAVRSADTAARLGGDEFVVIAEGLRNIDDVRSIASKILHAMRTPFELNGATLSITASIGVAVYTGEALKVEELVERADAALYRAKAAGRDRYELDERMEDFGTTSLIVTNLHGFMGAG